MDVLLIETVDEIEVVSLNRPGRLNAIDEPLAQALLTYFETRRRRADVRVILLTGAGRGFCAGADIKAAAGKGGEPLAGLRDGDWLLRDVVRAMRACPQPIIALVNGAAVGGGLALVLASDIVVAGESARFAAGFVDVGLTGAELGVGYRLQQTVGPIVARDMLYTGRTLLAHEAESAGLASRLVADGELIACGRGLATAMLRAAPDCLRLTKRSLDALLEIPSLEAALELEERGQMIAMTRPGARAPF